MQLIGTGKQRASKTARVLISSTALTFASWNVNLIGEDFPTVNFESYNTANAQSYGEGIMGTLSADVSFGGDWDAGTNPLDPTGAAFPGLYPRDDLASVSFYESRLDNVFWSFPYLRLRSSTNGAAIPGKVTFSVNGHNQGSFTFPAGSV